MRQSPLAIAVASASLVAMQSGHAADSTVSNPASCEADLRQAIANVVSTAGDMVIIDPSACPEITLTSAIVVPDQPFILSAPVGADGRPLVTITASSGTTFGLFDLRDTTDHGGDIVASVNARIPVIFSGLELTGASNNGPGGAIYASNHAVILDKSVVSNNTAVGSGGGIAVRGDLCLEGTEISGNRVTHDVEESVDGDVVTAVGGGAAVRGNVSLAPVLPEDSGIGLAGVCLSENSALLTNVSPEFAQAAGSLAGLPDTVEVIPSKITGNTVSVDVVLSDLTNPGAAGFFAFGGGLAAMADGVPREDSVLSGFFTPCASSLGADSTPAGSNCLLALASSIDANAVTMVIDDDLADAVPRGELFAGGGGLAAMTDGYARSSMNTSISNISGNSVAVTVPETANPYLSVVQGGGIGRFDFDDLPALIPIWEATSGLDFVGSNSGKYGSALLLASVVSGNSVSLQGAGAGLVGDAFAHVGGGGVAAISDEPDTKSSDEPDTKYDATVFSFLSSVSGNTVAVTAAGESYIDAQGGGISTGWLYSDAYLFAGKYLSYASGLSNNIVTVDGLAKGKAAGGGASASFTTKLSNKPQYTVVDEQALAEAKYLGDALDLNLASLWSDPGGVVDNKVDVTLADTAAAEVLAGGGGLLLGEKYSFTWLLGATVSGNSVEVDATSATGGNVTAIGGGAGTIPIRDDHASHLISVKYASIDDNAILVTAPVSVDVTAAGGGLAALQRNLFTGERNSPGSEQGGTNILLSTVSGNTITASGSPNSLAQGGGLAIETAGDDADLWYDPDYPSTVFPSTVGVSTIANNALVLTGGGTAQAGGLFAEVKYEPLIPLLVDKVTVAGNTSSVDDAVEGGQVYLGIAVGEPPALVEVEGVFLPKGGDVALLNSLVSGDTAQGEQDFYYNYTPFLWGTSIYHGPESEVVDLLAELGLLAPELADPTYLGDLQFNGGLADTNEGLKYGFGGVYNKTIPLLTGSGAIDPLPTDFYAEGQSCAFFDVGYDVGGEESVIYDIDQRGNEPVGCPDIGAYEFLGERDGDSLTDGTELVGAATDPELGYGRNSLPGLVNLLPSGDGNSDGVPDVNQAAVSTFTHTTPYGLRTITLATYSEETRNFASGETKAYLGTGSALADVETVATTARAVRIGGVSYDLDYGISFSSNTPDEQLEQFELILEGSSASNVALVKQVCDEDSGAFGEWRVLDSTPEPFGAGRFRLTWDITEGGDFDCNGDGGGIADPAYIATWDVVAVPTMPWFMVAGLSGLTALGGLLRLRRRRKVMGPRRA